MAAQVAADVVAGGGVERGQGLVQQQEGGVVRQGAGEGHPLGLPGGELPGPGRRPLRQPHPSQPPLGLPTGVGPADAPGAQTEGDVVAGVEVGEQEMVLEDDAHRPPLGGQVHACRRVVEDHAVELDAAAGERPQPRQGPEKGRLAGAVGTDHGQRPAGLDGQVDVEGEAVEVDPHLRPQAHRAVSHRSRRAMSTPRETASRTRDRTMAESGLEPSSLT